MPDTTTVQLERKIVRELKKEKRYKKQTYSELVGNLLEAYRGHRKQYDEFLHSIQQEKMAELWDNKDDGVWEDA